MTERHHIVVGLSDEEKLQLGIKEAGGADPRLNSREGRRAKLEEFGYSPRFRGRDFSVGARITEGMRLLHASDE